MEIYLLEQLKTISNLCKVATILYNMNGQELIPTILEIMKIEVDDVVDENCVVKEENL